MIFEPAILVGDFFIRIDILVKQGNRFELIEVKEYASSQLPANTLDDDVMISIIADGGAAPLPMHDYSLRESVIRLEI